MTPLLLGQLLGVSFACGLNLYATVAALGLFSRLGIIHDLPPALRGLESGIVIGTAVALFIIEAVIDRVPHADSLWDTVHTVIRPSAAALLAIGVLWAAPTDLVAGGAALAFVVALGAHGCKAGLRVALNTTRPDVRTAGISTGEDVAAVAFAVAAFQYPTVSLIAGGVVIAIMLVVGPRLWRAFALGLRCLTAWIRALFRPPRWIEAGELSRGLRALLPDLPLGAAPPRATRAAVSGLQGVGAYRNGWLVITLDGPLFLYRTLLGPRRADLPPAASVQARPGVWANVVRLTTAQGAAYTLYMLKDGPGTDVTLPELGPLAV